MSDDKKKIDPKGPKPSQGGMDPNQKVVLIQINGQTKRFHKDRIVIGSVISADIRLRDKSVAPVHAVIEVTDKAMLYDLGSKTGVLVNGKKIVTKHLKEGDSITVGSHALSFSFEDVEKAPSGERTKETLGGQKLFIDKKEDLNSLILETESDVEEIFDYKPTRGTALEVVMSWRGTVLAVEHFVKERSVTIGESYRSDFGIPPILGKGRYRIVNRTMRGFVLNLDDQMSGVIQSQGEMKDVKEVIKGLSGSGGKYQLPLSEADFAKISVGEIDFYLSFTSAPPRLKSQSLKRDPFFLKVMGASLAFSLAFLYLLLQLDIPKNLQAERLPEKVATILYHPEKYSYPARQKRARPKSRKEVEIPTMARRPMPRKTIRVMIRPMGMPRPMSAILTDGKSARGSSGGQRGKGMGRPGQSVSKEGRGARAMGRKGTRGSPKAAMGKRKQYYAKRPSARAGMGRGGGMSRVPGPTNLDALKGVGKEFVSLLGGSTKRLGKSGEKLQGYGAFTTKGSGGKALSGRSSGGGGQSTTAAGLANKGQGGGRVGTGLGAVGDGENIIGGKVRVALRRGGPEESIILGAIDKDAVEAALLAHKDEFRLCYEREINQGSPNIAGRVTTSFVIGGGGRVKRVGVASTTLKNPNTERCILKVIRRIQFPIPRGGGVVQVRYPFKFRPIGKR